MKNIKVGIVVNNLTVSKHIIELVEELSQNSNYRELVILRIGNPSLGSSLLKRQWIGNSILQKIFNLFDSILRTILLRIISKFEVFFARKSFKNYNKTCSLEPLDLRVLHMESHWSTSGYVVRLTQKSINILESENFDVLIRANSGILKGKVIQVAKHGILSFHLGDNRSNRGGPPGFWEVLNNEPSTGFIIQRLSEELDGGEVLFRGNVATSKFWYTNHAQIINKSKVFMRVVLERLIKEECLKSIEGPSLHHNPLYTLKGSSLDILKYAAITYVPFLLDKIIRIFRGPRISRWGIAYSTFSNLRTSLFRYKEIKNPKGRFFADPFVITHNDRTICFVEDYFYSDDKGRVSAIELTDHGYEFLGVVLEENFHLSYPFVFSDDSEIYMIPESSQAKQIRLYKCIEYPNKWKLHKVLMDNVRAADTSVIKIKGIWYMLTNICSAGIGMHSSELHIFYSEDIDSDIWRPLKCGNPVLFDARYCRNGGLFNLGEKLIRVNQVQGKGTYGESFCLNEITHLSPEGYAEICLDRVYPNFFSGINRTHHFHTDENFSVIDFARPERLRTAKIT